ncbi:MAG: type II CAAX endopeptidase family protein [Chitinophagales bacterium]
MEEKNTPKETPKGFFRNNPLLVFIWTVLPIIVVFTSTLLTASATDTSIDNYGSIVSLSIAQIVSVVILFVLPVLLLSFVYKRNIFGFLNMLKLPSVKQVAFVLALILSSNLFLNFLMEINEMIPLSEGLEAKFTALQESTIAMQGKFLDFSNVFEFVLILFVMAILPALAEEMYFRGLIEGVLFDLKVGPFHAIFISSLLFAMVHFQFYYLLPLFFMGALLGYIYYRTKNLWLTIIAHFVNNGVMVVITATNKLGYTNMDVEGTPPLLTSVIGFVVFMAIIYFFHNNTKQTKFE